MAGQMATPEAVRAAKQVVRAAVEVQLGKMGEESRARQSENVLRKLLAHPAFECSRSVAVYLSTASEVDTRPVLEALFASGRACFVPRYAWGAAARERAARGVPDMEMVLLRGMDDYRALSTTPWGIAQPGLDDPRPRPGEQGLPPLDLVLVPGLAFTAAGERLGRGKGFYDRFLAGLPPPRPATVALAFSAQLLQRLPTEDTDVSVDHVLAADE